MTAKTIHFPTTRLAELAARSGGIERQQALENAQKSVEELRELAEGAIDGGIRAMEAVVYAARHNRLLSSELKQILIRADQLVSLTATFGLLALEGAAKSLCDVAHGMIGGQLQDAAPILVHVQALRLFAPGNGTPTAEQSQRILSELARVRAHFQFAALSAAGEAEIGPNIES